MIKVLTWKNSMTWLSKLCNDEHSVR